MPLNSFFCEKCSFDVGLDRLRTLVKNHASDVRFAFEFRHESWFMEETCTTLRENNITMAWSEIFMVKTPPVLTTGNVCLRLVGDRSINEKDLGRIQKDRTPEIEKWSRRIQEAKHVLDHVFIFANNHFQGFGPGTVNLFRRSLVMDPVDWTIAMNRIVGEGQETLF